MRKDGFDLVSGVFGNTIGLFESREGKLYEDEVARRRIKALLRPLDILVEKTPFRLTDKLIPGHFGHVAIWTGTQAELMDARVWEDTVAQLAWSSWRSCDSWWSNRRRVGNVCRIDLSIRWPWSCAARTRCGVG